MDKVRKNGRPVNYQTLGASLAILGNRLVSQLEQNNNPNSQVQHVLVPPATMINIPNTFTSTNRTTRKNMSEQLNLPSVGDLTRDEYKLSNLRLKIIIPIRDILPDPGRKTFQWSTLTIEMHKLPGESQCGCRTWYFHPAHDVTNENHRTSMYQHIKSVAEKTRALVKSNFNCQKNRLHIQKE